MQPIPFAWYELFKMHIEHSLDQSIKKYAPLLDSQAFAFKELFINRESNIYKAKYQMIGFHSVNSHCNPFSDPYIGDVS